MAIKEDSIEKYVKILERFSNENVIYGSTVGMTLEKYIDLQLSIKHILSDYKRVLKENEELKSDNLEYQRIQDIFDKRTYRKKYLEERRKEESNLLYPDADEIYRRYYELKKENEQLHKFILKGITIENSPFQNYQLDILRENFIPIWRIKNLIKELKQDDINMTRKYKEKKNITGELLGIDKVRVRAYREKTREIKEKLQKLLSDWEKGK